MLSRSTSRILALFTLLLLPASVGAQEPLVHFITPRELMTVVGETPIELSVQIPAGAEIERLEVVIDGRQTLTLSGPPWKTLWQASEEGLPYELNARLYLKDGRVATRTVRTSRLTISEVVYSDVVDLYVVVFDPQGNRITDLERDAFRIYEDGVEQQLSHFTQLEKPLRTALVLDTSKSMEHNQRLEKSKRAAISFLDVMRKGDQGSIASFNDEVYLGESFTADRSRMESEIMALSPQGGTALYDAIWRTSRLLDGFDGRRVIVLLSDGRDEAYDGLGPGSLHTLDEALEQAQYSDVMIFTIGLGRGLEDLPITRWEGPGGRSGFDRSTSQADVLRHVANSTGGSAEFSASPGNLRRAFDRIAADLRHQYSIGYTPSNRLRDGKWRKIRIEIPGTRMRVVTRKGYYGDK